MIQDDFTARPGISRQRRWQLRQHAKGRCVLCGRKSIDRTHCAKHRRQHNLRQKRYHRKRRGSKLQFE